MSLPARAGTVTRTRLTAVALGDCRRRTADALATEEPMEIRVDAPGMEQRRVAVTMRTPGSDFELAAGFLYTEGIVAGTHDVTTVRYCSVPRDEQMYNVVTVDLTRPYDADLLQRNFYTTSSCGVCGKASLDSIAVRCAPVAEG
ncbi:MAG TPA: formate dehydrogenase accessory sulfurtransferase FdhD, partial [Gaiellales bacterium]